MVDLALVTGLGEASFIQLLDFNFSNLLNFFTTSSIWGKSDLLKIYIL